MPDAWTGLYHGYYRGEEINSGLWSKGAERTLELKIHVSRDHFHDDIPFNSFSSCPILKLCQWGRLMPNLQRRKKKANSASKFKSSIFKKVGINESFLEYWMISALPKKKEMKRTWSEIGTSGWNLLLAKLAVKGLIITITKFSNLIGYQLSWFQHRQNS